MQTSASATLAQVCYSCENGFLVVDNNIIVDRIRKSKLSLQKTFGVAISLKKTRATIKNGSDRAYCDIFQELLQCDRISIDTLHSFSQKLPQASDVRIPSSPFQFSTSWNPPKSLPTSTSDDTELNISESPRAITLRRDSDTCPSSDFPIPPPLRVNREFTIETKDEVVDDEWKRFSPGQQLPALAVPGQRRVAIPVPIRESDPPVLKCVDAPWNPVNCDAPKEVPVFKPMKIGHQTVAVSLESNEKQMRTTVSSDALNEGSHKEPARSQSMDFATVHTGKALVVKGKTVAVSGDKEEMMKLKRELLRIVNLPCDVPVMAFVFNEV